MNHLPTLGIGAVLLVLQMFLVRRCRRKSGRGLLTAAAAVAILLNVLLLETGHQGQRMRSPKPESPVAVSPYRFDARRP